MMESGVVGVLASLLLLYAVWLRLGQEGRAVLVGMAVNSFFANGYFQSPLLAMNLSLVLATGLLVTLLRDLQGAGGQVGTTEPLPPDRP
jgi:hypothetical protein